MAKVDLKELLDKLDLGQEEEDEEEKNKEEKPKKKGGKDRALTLILIDNMRRKRAGKSNESKR
jgi:hypothetical protein